MYEDTYGTDWDAITSREEAVQRAFALGVAAQLGERYPGELDRIAEEVTTTYDRSFVNLAYQKGQNQAGQVGQRADDEAVWTELVEEKTEIELVEHEDSSDRTPETDRDEDDMIPDAVRGFDIDTLPDDSTEVVKRPGFLERQSAEQAASSDGGDPSLFGDGRTVFGRSLDDVQRSRDVPGGAESGDADDDSSEEPSPSDADDGNDADGRPTADAKRRGGERDTAPSENGADGRTDDGESQPSEK
ncbi:hypothetical protein [Halopiger djelfimassiliensis]|uniref:hypothetical protein n=1 Tax=Halopiger djelfimassiliensis TaxID=1293047 RepID=UPI000677AAC0|nr:hypothetical protein [Halopiger djelfimassiliensis]